MEKDLVISQEYQHDIAPPSLPHAVLKFLDAVQNDSVSMARLSRIASSDPALASQILKLANSPLFSARANVHSLSQATVLLGLRTIQNLALTLSVLHSFSGLASRTSFSLASFWWHSLATAVTARRIAEKVSHRPLEEAFIAGLLHDIGQVMFLAHDPAAFEDIVQAGGDGHTLLKAERRVFGFDHAQFGGDVLEKWKLQPLLCDAIRYHHHPIADIKNSLPLVRIVAIANHVSHALQGSANASSGRARDLLAEFFGLSHAAFDDLREEVLGEVDAMAEVLGIPVDCRESGQIPERLRDEREARDKVRQRTLDHALLLGGIESLLSSRTCQELCENAAMAMGTLFDCGGILIADYEDDAGFSGIYALGTRDDALALRIRIPAIPGDIWEHAFKSRFPIHSGEFRAESVENLVERQIATYLGGEYLVIPLFHRAERVGMITAALTLDEWLSLGDAKGRIMLFARQFAVALFLERERKRRSSWLSRELGKKTRELEDAHARIVQAERLGAAGAIARKVAHEVNNPLGIIKNYLAIQKRLGVPQDMEESLGVIEGEIDRIGRIISQLRDFSAKGEAGGSAGEIRRVLDDLQVLIRDTLKEKGILLQIVADPGLPRVALSADGLTQVLINLVKNAEEALAGQTGKIRISARMSGAPGNDVVIEVADSGPGIAPSVREHIFEPFVTTKEGGGLGLSVCHGLVRSAGGTIAVVDCEGWGACFQIRLPAVTHGDQAPGAGSGRGE